MRARIIILCIVLLSAMVSHAEGISREQAKKVASAFLSEMGTPQELTALDDGKKMSSRRRAAANAESEYYVFNKGENGGFIIVSGDDTTEPILGYCDEGSFDYDNLPPALQALLERHASQIAWLKENSNTAAARTTQRRAGIPTHPKVEQLLTCTWGQGDPYNRMCPMDNGKRAVTGCVATALAQVLYFHREKMVTETLADISGYQSWTKKLNVPGIAKGTALDWDNMRDKGGSNDLQKNAVAQLMVCCGTALDMDYTNSSSGTNKMDRIPQFVKTVLGMSEATAHHWADDDEVATDKAVYDELAAGRPVYIGGYTGDMSMGHAFVTDGYDGNRHYHINWGWDGGSNGYYYLSNLTPGQQGIGGNDNGEGYSTGINYITGMEPVNFTTRELKFADSNVKALCLANWDSDGDGKLTYGEAAAVTSLETVFKGQKRISTLNELYYFTSLKEISDEAFSGCTQLTALRLPKTLKAIGSKAFKDCAKLTSVELPAGITTIKDNAFNGCKLLNGITLPEQLKTIEAGTFYGCQRLQELELPISITSIGDSALAACTKLEQVTVKTFSPATITLGKKVFDGSSLEEATLQTMQGTGEWFGKAEQWKEFGNIIEERERSGGVFATPKQDKSYYIYNIGTGQYLTQGEAYNTQAVVSATDAPIVVTLKHTAAMGDGVYSLRVNSTGKDLFRTSEDGNVGKGIPAVFVDGSNKGAAAYWKLQQVTDCPYGDNVYTLQIPQNKTGYVEGQYLGVQTNHASNAAQPTYGLYSDIDYSTNSTGCMWKFVAYDEQKAHEYQSVNILGNLLTQAKRRGIKAIQERKVYDNMESQDSDIKKAQRSLRNRMSMADFPDVNAHQTFADLADISSDNEVSLTEAAVVKELNINLKNDQSITNVEGLKHFTSVTALPASLFYGCKNLTKVWLPTSITKINNLAFYNCTALSRITLPVSDPEAVTVGTTAFNNVNLAAVTLRVPYGSGDSYKASATWSKFGNIVEMRLDAKGAELGNLLETATEAGIDTEAEQTVYYSHDSSDSDLTAAIDALRKKLHYIDFTNVKTHDICVENWDQNFDGELSTEEAAQVTAIGDVFRNNNTISSLEELKYFTALTEIPANAFRSMSILRTVFLPENVKQIGEFAFGSSDNLRYLVLLNSNTMVPQTLLGLPSKKATLFVPETMVAAYQNDAEWAKYCNVTAYTGKAEVTAEATREYGSTSADINLIVTGAPITGDPVTTCDEISDSKAAVGTYPIIIERGTVTDATVTIANGLLTITPYPVVITANSYTRNIGEENPTFEYTYERLPNREKAEKVFTKQPTMTCSATADSPAGEYTINISGAEAQNYTFTYEAGTLTIVDPTGVNKVERDADRQEFYDLQGRKVVQPKRGLYINDKRKIVVK